MWYVCDGCRVRIHGSDLLLCKFCLQSELESLAGHGCLPDLLTLSYALGVRVAQLSIVNLGGYVLELFRFGEIVCDD